ncbi:MAG: helix-hairpin-helix domain-containing protein [Methylophilaceae bacterium]
MKKILFAIFYALSFSLSAFSFSAYATVDLNAASSAELQTVNGIGPKKAEAIIEYRKKNGQFKSVDDLDKVPGFGQATVNKVKKDISVGNTKAAAAGKSDKVVNDAKASMPASAVKDKK